MFEELTKKTLEDNYFKKLLSRAERIVAYNFFQINCGENFLEKEYIDLLRFGDILSHSTNPEARNLAYKIISLLVDEKKDDYFFKIFATAILSKLGNFPALQFLLENFQYQEKLPFERELERKLKEEIQKVPDNEKIFTDSQYEIFEALKNNNHFSFSGPTSLGKSFIIEAFIRYLISSNGTKNIIILVPTRALINQVLLKLKDDLKGRNNYKVLSHPIVPKLFKKSSDKYIFVFTPERLLSYLSVDNPPIEYLFIDEAQKIISEKDTRSPLYYHSILQAQKKSIKLYFSSPNIPNPEIFLQLFEKSTKEVLAIKDSPVSQNRYLLDLEDKNILLFSETGTDIDIPTNIQNNDFFYWLMKLGEGKGNIIYCNTIIDTIDYALALSEKLPVKDHPKIKETIKMIEKYLHRQYFLIDCLRKGIAFHFGKLPQKIRVRIEELFREKIIDYMFCTSTLLEGVNLPAKNIFIINNAIGRSKFTDIDFWNLAGRAGRLLQELSGNIICVRIANKRNSWNNLTKDLEKVRDRSIKQALIPISIKNERIFEGIKCSLTRETVDEKKSTHAEREIWNHYANIALIQEKSGDKTVLKSNFEEKIKEGGKLLKDMDKKISVPTEVLSASSSIKAEYQNNIFQSVSPEILPSIVNKESSLKFLNFFYDEYVWEIEESSKDGRQLINMKIKNPRKILNYYAMLIDMWANSNSLSKIIEVSIGYYRQHPDIWDDRVHKLIKFNSQDRYHINMVINRLISDIENNLRYKLEKYFNNYYLLLVEKFGKEKAGANWAEFLEYGTTDNRIMELQNIGLPRHLAKYILENHTDCLKYENNILEDFDQKKLEKNFDHESDEYNEYKEFF